jgi:methylmalonyl-CoA mutase N-terminal domain/subunit
LKIRRVIFLKKEEKSMETEKEFKTASSILTKEVYTPSDLDEIGFDYSRDLSLPGNYPFVRGIVRDMYRGNLWIMGQYSGYGTAEESNRRYKYLIDQGATGFSIALDLPTQIGYDSDHPMAQGEVGKVGVAIDSLRDMETLFDGIPLNRVRQIRTTANAIGPIFVALFLAIAEKQGISPLEFSILIQNDVLKEYVARGTYIFPPKPSVRVSTDVIEYCSTHLPEWIPINFCGYHLREAGCTAVQEIAFTFANAIAYIESTIARGLQIDQLALKSTCMFSGGIDLFEEIAKFRAARKIWAKLMKERFEAKDPRSQSLRIFCFTAGSNLTIQQPLNNIVRVTLEALGAVLGGVQIMATSSYDEGYATPSHEAATIALRTQQIIACESGVINTVDPLGGSFFIERLTHEIEERVWKYIGKIDEMGGAIAAIENRFFQNEIEEAAHRYQKKIENRENIIVGVNAFKSNDVTKIETLKVDPEVEVKQVKTLLKMKRDRDNNKVKKCLSVLKQVTKEGENIIPATFEAVKAYATVGEICSTLKEVFGEYKEFR